MGPPSHKLPIPFPYFKGFLWEWYGRVAGGPNFAQEFTGSDGKELTLNSAEDRDEICTEQLKAKAALLYGEDDDS